MWDSFVHGLTKNLDNAGESVGSWINEHALNIVIILVGAYVFRRVGTRLILGVIKKTLRHDLFPTEVDREKRVKTLNSLVKATMRVASWVIAFTMIIGEIGINTGPLIASAGVIGIALGFGAQSLIKDFVSGIFIIVENQYRVGDVVELGGVVGTVEGITIRTTVLRDLSGNRHHIPNGTITMTTNKTMEFARINEDIVVGMDTDVDQLEHVINHVGEELAAKTELRSMVIEAPHLATVKAFDKDGIKVKVLGKTTPGDQWQIRSEFFKLLKKSFDKHNIELPSQQITIHKEERKKSK